MPRTPKSRANVTPPRPRLVRRLAQAPPAEPAAQIPHEAIAERAYLIFEREGFVHGRAVEHWHQAEQELLLERRLAPVRRVAARAKGS